MKVARCRCAGADGGSRITDGGLGMLGDAARGSAALTGRRAALEACSRLVSSPRSPASTFAWSVVAIVAAVSSRAHGAAAMLSAGGVASDLARPAFSTSRVVVNFAVA